MKPVRYESGIPFFSKSEMAIYGMPDLYGYSDYIVIDDEEPVYVMDYSTTIERRLRPIHRYNRTERFTFILGQLLGLRGDVDGDVVAMCRGCKDWEEIRKTLRDNGKQKLYNRIPTIMNILKIPAPISLDVSNEKFFSIVRDFQQCQKNFNESSILFGRKYFPSLRYIAIKLLEKHGAEFDEKVKFIRTRHKLKSLNTIWTWIC